MAHSRQICQFNSPTVIPIMDFLNHSKKISNVEMNQTGTSYKCQAIQDIKQVRFSLNHSGARPLKIRFGVRGRWLLMI